MALTNFKQGRAAIDALLYLFARIDQFDLIELGNRIGYPFIHLYDELITEGEHEPINGLWRVYEKGDEDLQNHLIQYAFERRAFDQSL